MSYSKYDTIGRNPKTEKKAAMFKVGDEVTVMVGEEAQGVCKVAEVKGGRVKLEDFNPDWPIYYSNEDGRNTKRRDCPHEFIRLSTFGDEDNSRRNKLAYDLQYASFSEASLADLEEIAELLKKKGIRF